MSIWFIVQVGFNFFFLATLFLTWKRLLKPAKDDPRLSRGLQILQSKIAILEDLSDRTDVQAKQLMVLLDQKGKDLQVSVDQAEQQIHAIRKSMDQSLEVAQIFEDKIPHQEIIQRQTTKKYIQAARLAHSGTSLDEISKVVDLPRGELEMIAKMNRERLLFSDETLPAWAKTAENNQGGNQPNNNNSFIQDKKNPATDRSLRQLGEEFRRAVTPTTRFAPDRITESKLFQSAERLIDPAAAQESTLQE